MSEAKAPPGEPSEWLKAAVIGVAVVGIGVAVGLVALGRRREQAPPGSMPASGAPGFASKTGRTRTTKAAPAIGRAAPRQRVATEGEMDQALRRRLAVPVSVNFIGCEFDYFLQAISKLGGPSVRVENVPGRHLPKITLAVTNMPLDALLRWVCRQNRCSWRVGNGGIVLVPGEETRLPAPPPRLPSPAMPASRRL